MGPYEKAAEEGREGSAGREAGRGENRYRRAKASRPWDGWPWLDRGERVRNGISKVWSKELEGKELLPAGHHIGGDFAGVITCIITGVGCHSDAVLYASRSVIVKAVKIVGRIVNHKFRMIGAH